MTKISEIQAEVEKLEGAPETILDRVLNDVKEFTEHRIDLKAGPPKSPKLTWEELQAFDSPSEHVGFLEGSRVGYLNDKIDGEFSEEECLDRIYTGFRHKYMSTGLVIEDVIAAKNWGAAAKEMGWANESQTGIFHTIETVCAYIMQNSLSRQQITEDKLGITSDNKGRYGDGVSELLSNVLNYLDARCLEFSGWQIDDIRAVRCKERIVKKQEMNVPEAEILDFIKSVWLTPDEVGYVPTVQEDPPPNGEASLPGKPGFSETHNEEGQASPASKPSESVLRSFTDDEIREEAAQRGMTVTNVETSPVPDTDLHPWLTKMLEFEGLDEVDDNAKLTAFLGIDPEETPWCAAMLSSCLKACEKPALGLRARDYATYGAEGDGSIGDIAVWQSHVGVVASETEIIGGNVTNEVKRSPHPNTGKDWFKKFIGFRKVV